MRRDEWRCSRQVGAREEGAVIVEFAAIFVVFAMLLAGIITYGMVFAVQQSLTYATSEAARSVVGISSAQRAEETVDAVLENQLEWMGGLDAVERSPLVWSNCSNDQCFVEVEVTYEGGLLSLFPYQVAVPSQLQAAATLQHDVSEP